MVKKYLPAVLAVLIILGVFGFIIYTDQQSTKEQSAKTADSPRPTAATQDTSDISEDKQDAMESNTTPGAKKLAEPKMTIDSAKSYTAVLQTDKGNLTIELNAKDTPITANNFVYLARQKFYDNTVFHRVIKGFMIQGGDPTGTGAGGPGYRFNDEKFSGSYDRGVVAMANAGPNTNGSQFFIMHGEQDLPPNYVIFGKVTEGLDAVDAIATAEVAQSASGEPSKPVTPVKIKSVDIIEK